MDRIIYTAEMLGDFPLLGSVWEGGETRSLLVSSLPYRIHYRVVEAGGMVEIITVAHTSQLPPEVG